MNLSEYNKQLAENWKKLNPESETVFWVTSKKGNPPPGKRIQSLHDYFELGWEVSTTHLDIKHLIATGKVKKDDVIVTLKGREFLYSRVANVMSWEEMSLRKNIDCRNTINAKNVVDLSWQYCATTKVDAFRYHPKYKYAELIKPLLVNLDVPDVEEISNEPFAVCGWRYRPEHVPERNTPQRTAKLINEELLNHVSKIFVVGQNGAESFCDGNKIVHVDLRTFAALLLNKNCVIAVGAMTGTMQLAAILCKTKVAIIQHNPMEQINNDNHPCVFGECVNIFNNKRMMCYETEVPVEEYIKKLNQFLNQ